MLLEAHGISYSYNSRAHVLYDIAFTVDENQIIGLIGPNGSGKSTLIKLIVDLLQLRRGSLLVDSHRSRSRRAKMSSMYLASNEFMPEFLSGEEYLRLIHGLYREVFEPDEMRRLFQRYSMAGRSGDLVEDYSHGMRKKLQLISAIMLKRKLTVIDETLNGIDLDAQYAFEEDLRRLSRDGRSAILCSHDFPALERVTDRTLLLHRGVLAVDMTTVSAMREHGSLDALVKDFIQVMG